MAAERLSMRQTREILRQKWTLGRTHGEVAQSLGISSGAVGTTVLRARAAGLDWALRSRSPDPCDHDGAIGVTTMTEIRTPAEVYLEGFVELAARNGLMTVALINEDSLFPRAVVKGASELVKKKGLQVVFAEAYPRGSSDLSAILTRLRATTPDAVGAGTLFEDAVAITRQIKQLNVNPKMYAAGPGVALPKFHEALGRTAEFVYGPSQWELELMTLRAGGLIPIARHYPGAHEFVEAHMKEYPGADLSFQTAAGYGGCQVLTEAVKRAGSLDGEKVRNAILKLDFNTVYGAFKVDRDGLQIGHRMVLFQWQDDKKVIVWPEELAPGKPRFPRPPWSERR